MYFTLLLTFATVAATLVVFISVVFILGRRSEGYLNKKERTAMWSLLVAIFSALFLSLLVASLLAGFPADEPAVWRIGNGIAAIMHLLGAGKHVGEMMRGEAGMFRWAAIPAPIGGFAAAFANLAIAFGYFPNLGPIAFVLSILWMLMVSALAFAFLLSTEETASSE